MSTDRSSARCSFCGRHTWEVQRMIAGPGAAYICDTCLQLCSEILTDTSPFSTKALELASRPPVVVAAPQNEQERSKPLSETGGPLRSMTLEIEQKQRGMTLLLHQLNFYQNSFELRYLWMRPTFPSGFAFVPRILFSLRDSTGTQWNGARGGTLLARPELAADPNNAVYQGNARFQPLPSSEARTMTVRAVDPLSQFEEEAARPWQFEITLQVI